MENVSKIKLVEKYKNYAATVRENWGCAPEDFLVDIKSIEKLCIGLGDYIIAKELIPREPNGKINQHNGLMYCLKYDESFRGKKNIDGNLALLSHRSITITNYEKTLTFWNPMIAYKSINEGIVADPESLIGHAFFMTEVTPEGFFTLFLDKSNNDRNYLNFYRNDDIIDCGCLTDNKEEIESIKYDIAHGDTLYLGAIIERLSNRRAFSIPLPQISIDKKDFALLANKIYRKGLQYVSELGRNGGILEITDEDRRFFDERQEASLPLESLQKEKISLNIDTDNEKLLEIIQSLKSLEKTGVELSNEQKRLLNIYDKLNPEKVAWYHDKINSVEFQQYQSEQIARQSSQKEIREQIARKNAANEQWLNSPENPANVRIKKIEELKAQISALNNFKMKAPDMLTVEQINFLAQSQEFLDMLYESSQEKHEVDTGMSPEIRDWYKQRYESQETPKKSK